MVFWVGFYRWVFYWEPCLDGGVEAGVLQRTVVDEHEAVPGDEAAVLLRHAARHQRPDHDHRFLEQKGKVPVLMQDIKSVQNKPHDHLVKSLQ